jgi:hypothetical protein
MEYIRALMTFKISYGGEAGSKVAILVTFNLKAYEIQWGVPWTVK